MNELAELLFSRRIPALGNRALFLKIAEVAEAIRALPPGTPGLGSGSQKSVESYLGQVLRGDRRCSKGLREAILASVVARLGLRPDESSDWQEQVDKAIAQVNLRVNESNGHSEEALSAEKLYERLLTFSSAAELQVIVTPVSLEEETRSKRANALRDILTSRLRLQPGQKSKATGRQQNKSCVVERLARYVFVLPGTLSAQTFWASLFYEITGRLGASKGLDEDEASSRLQSVDQGDALQVYVAKNSAICSLPIVAFDPNPRRGSRAAFSFCFDKDDRIRIVEWDEDATRAWVDNFYKLFYCRPLELTRRYRWSEAEAHLREGHG